MVRGTPSPGSQASQHVRTPSPSTAGVVQRLGIHVLPPMNRSLLPSPSVGKFNHKHTSQILHNFKKNHNILFFGVTGTKLTTTLPGDNDGDDDAEVNPHDESGDNDEEEDDDSENDDNNSTSGDTSIPTGPPLTQIIDQFDLLPRVVSVRPGIAMRAPPPAPAQPPRKKKLVDEDDEDESTQPRPSSTSKKPKITDVIETGKTFTILSLPS